MRALALERLTPEARREIAGGRHRLQASRRRRRRLGLGRVLCACVRAVCVCVCVGVRMSAVRACGRLYVGVWVRERARARALRVHACV